MYHRMRRQRKHSRRQLDKAIRRLDNCRRQLEESERSLEKCKRQLDKGYRCLDEGEWDAALAAANKGLVMASDRKDFTYSCLSLLRLRAGILGELELPLRLGGLGRLLLAATARAAVERYEKDHPEVLTSLEAVLDSNRFRF
ncbi:hypothetical protein NQ176_g9369 [Zarea fungicola]|uniref:Uncharacterized protein n=1 Tax=Zarea fungicola TaxID=93591 RepID=A0ACC1MM27_9HYPO|nr:hypothetical protein NQ176_g9369 [Lecanicillium fungicola]